LPFEEQDLDGEQVMKAVLAGERPELPVSVDPIIKKLIDACWHQEPEKRLSFANIIEELDPVQSM
jgi:hypothetical protein